MNAVSDQNLAVDATVRQLTIPDGAKRCYIEVHTSSIYYTFDGVDPSSSNGGRADPGDIIPIMGDGQESMNSIMSGWRGLEQTATDSLAVIHYFE